MISVIIPCNKDRGYLERAYQSVMSQTYQNFEVIVEMADEPMSVNINNAVGKAEGQFIKILSEDDWLPENALMDLRKSIGNEYWVVGWGKNYITPTDEIINVKPYPQFTIERLLQHNFLHGGAVMYRIEMFYSGGFDETLTNAEEYEFHLRLLSKGYYPAFCPSFVYNHTVHPDQKSRLQRGSKEREAQLELIKKRYV